MMYLFHVEEEKLLSPCTFASAKNISKRKKTLGRDRTEVSAASDRGSYFEKEKLIALNRNAFYTCPRHLSTCFVRWNVNPHEENYFPTNLVTRAVEFRSLA